MKFSLIPTKNIFLFCSLMLIGTSVFSQTTVLSSGLNAALVPSSAQLNSANENEKLSDPATWTEVIAERKVYSSTYHTPEGQVIFRTSTRPINYDDGSGQLKPINAKLKPSAEGWSAPDQPNPTFLFTDGSAAVSIAKDSKMIFGINCTINGQKLKKSCSVDGNKITFSNIASGVDKEYIFHENAVKYNYILHQQVSTTDIFLRISEEISFPQGYKLVRNNEHGREENGGWSGDLSLVNNAGEIVSRFLAPICYDADKKFTIATYLIKEEAGKHILEMIIPAAWLNDPARSFPIVIDPLVIGPTATWSSGAMPSCIIPTYNKDSILVTIPAGITTTGLYVTSSYYADPFTPAVMSEGSMFFSSICGTTTTFTIPNPTGNTPGTAYLDTFNLHAPMMCCFPPSCNVRTFYVRMHLGRTGPSVGCNTTYIRYDPLTTLWPFSAYVVGHTPETYGNQWFVPLTPICSNHCTITGTVYVRYGVPPFTMTHPWAIGTVTIGTPIACNNNVGVHTFTLTIPNCPTFCDTTSHLIVPPPVIHDACGFVVSGLPSRSVPLKETPAVTATPTFETVCSGNPAVLSFTSCMLGDSISWFGNNTSGVGNISNVVTNNTTSSTIINYSAYTSTNGCISDTVIVPVTVDPLPAGNYIYSPIPCIVNIPINFLDTTTIYAGTEGTWSWNFGDNSTSTSENPTHTFVTPGTYHVCLIVASSHGCVDTICKDILVIPADVIAPNVVTPNNDGLNDSLKFKYLEFYPGNQLQIFDRWGNLIYERSGYVNDWMPAKLNDGTYYYVLNVKDTGKIYKGFFEVLR